MGHSALWNPPILLSTGAHSSGDKGQVLVGRVVSRLATMHFRPTFSASSDEMGSWTDGRDSDALLALVPKTKLSCESGLLDSMAATSSMHEPCFGDELVEWQVPLTGVNLRCRRWAQLELAQDSSSVNAVYPTRWPSPAPAGYLLAAKGYGCSHCTLAAHEETLLLRLGHMQQKGSYLLPRTRRYRRVSQRLSPLQLHLNRHGPGTLKYYQGKLRQDRVKTELCSSLQVDAWIAVALWEHWKALESPPMGVSGSYEHSFIAFVAISQLHGSGSALTFGNRAAAARRE
ncbi:hypothetical protein CCMA1212_007290 [Trichoderma ghanense]|uniref:Uncharacterized protein n=1 Tax=Trichoderma ghanense TaxID=65468 RepID=A0ABY2GZP9_9HYPO